jgi:hypothetical protein
MAALILRLNALLVALVVMAACGSEQDDSVARVTIDMRCGSTAKCPGGFACEAETEHGPPTTMCESRDPAAVCPSGYETQIGYGQTFCKPFSGVSSRNGRGSTSVTVRSRRVSRAVAGSSRVGSEY